MANISPGVAKSPSDAIKVSINRKYQRIARFKKKIWNNPTLHKHNNWMYFQIQYRLPYVFEVEKKDQLFTGSQKMISAWYQKILSQPISNICLTEFLMKQKTTISFIMVRNYKQNYRKSRILQKVATLAIILIIRLLYI